MGKDGKPKGRTTSYAFFLQTCRDEHKRKHPNESVSFQEFSKKCSEKWKCMDDKEKKRFIDLADKDKCRYETEMKTYIPPAGEEPKGRKRKQKKDPNAPKRPLSAFFMYCKEQRPKLLEEEPRRTVGELGSALGKMWKGVTDDDKVFYQDLANKDKERYERDMAVYNAGGGVSGMGSPPKKARAPAKKPVAAPVAVAAAVADEDDEDDSDAEDDSDEDGDDE